MAAPCWLVALLCGSWRFVPARGAYNLTALGAIQSLATSGGALNGSDRDKKKFEGFGVHNSRQSAVQIPSLPIPNRVTFS